MSNRQKITNTIILVVITVICLLPPISSVIIPLYFTTLLLYNLPIYFILIILLVYIFACYIEQSKKWLKGVAVYLIILTIITLGIIFFIDRYNKKFGYSCNKNTDCQYDCPAGAVNNNYIKLTDPLMHINCRPPFSTVCENRKCKNFRDTDVISVEDCGKAKETFKKDNCYWSFAKKLNDASLCNSIEEDSFKENCIKQVKENDMGW
jgi:hypothetical protein